MAQPTNLYSTADSIGQREDLLDWIALISPTRTPFYDSVAVGSAAAINPEWQRDQLAAAAFAPLDEGRTFAAETVTPTERLQNAATVLGHDFVISDTQDVVETAGRATESGYQIMRHGAQIKRNFEVGSTGAQGSDFSGPRVMAGAEAWIETNVNSGVGYTAGGWNNTTRLVEAPGDGTQRDFDETQLIDVLTQCYNEGGEVNLVLMQMGLKNIFSTFTGNSTRFQGVEAEKQAVITSGADVYVSGSGIHAVEPDRFMRDRTVLCLDTNMWEFKWLRRPFVVELGQSGDNRSFQVTGEGTVCALEERSSGKVADLNPV